MAAGLAVVIVASPVAADARTAEEVKALTERAVAYVNEVGRERAFADLDPFNQMLAVTETVAHLDVLAVQHRLAVTTDEHDVRHYAKL